MKRKELKEFRIKYYFDGCGEEVVKAESEEKAKEMFYNGEMDFKNEWGDSYIIDVVEPA